MGGTLLGFSSMTVHTVSEQRPIFIRIMPKRSCAFIVKHAKGTGLRDCVDEGERGESRMAVSLLDPVCKPIKRPPGE